MAATRRLGRSPANHAPYAANAIGKLATIVPQEVDGELLVGPLVHDQAFVGCMILVAEHRMTFKPDQVEIGRHLLEPFAIALGQRSSMARTRIAPRSR